MALAACGRRLQDEKMEVVKKPEKPVGVYVERDPREIVYVACHRGGVPTEINEGDEVFIPWLKYKDLDKARAELWEFAKRKNKALRRHDRWMPLCFTEHPPGPESRHVLLAVGPKSRAYQLLRMPS